LPQAGWSQGFLASPAPDEKVVKYVNCTVTPKRSNKEDFFDGKPSKFAAGINR
jgi:hypothetical protein